MTIGRLLNWLSCQKENMGDSYVVNDQYGTYFLTFQIIAWVDIFTRKCYCDIIVESLNFCVENKGLKVHAWAIMSNHVHCLMTSSTGRLSATLRDFKSYTAKRILETIKDEKESRRVWILFQFKRAARCHERNSEFQVWTHENHAVEIDPHIPNIGISKFNYIHNNPVRAGWVEEAHEYLYSSARDYARKRNGRRLEPTLRVKLAMW